MNSLATELRNTLGTLYRIQDSNTICDLAMNHLLSTLDESLRGDVKTSQLTENKTLENLLEFVKTKMSLQSFSHGVEYAAITSLENMMEKLLMDRTS